MRLGPWFRALLLPVSLLAPSFAQNSAGPATRLYIEPFATKADAAKLRSDLAAELRKSGSIAIVDDAAAASLTLAGGGEIWIRGYRSFSPRSHGKISANGTPLYAGYLSVELKDQRGVTIWSSLAVPSASTEDISKDLAKRVARQVIDATRSPQPALSSAPPPHLAVDLKGAGATFPYPVYQKWFTNYRVEQPGVTIAYDPIGSDAGIRKLLAGEIDFGASDSPEAVHQISPADESRYLFFPSVIGAVSPIVNLPGISGEIAFTPEALAGIFLGTIKKWNDPILVRANKGIPLPDLAITVVHRADGSGTSFALTDYLSKSSAEWKSQVGVSLTPRWPVGRAAAGNDGVAKLVKELGGSIGYVEYIYALQNHLGYGKVRNRNGEFVGASLASIAAAVEHSAQPGEDFRASLTDAPGEGSYPIASFTWMVVPAHITDPVRRTALTAFLQWMLGPGQRQAAALGYLPLPKELIAREQSAIAKIE